MSIIEYLFANPVYVASGLIVGLAVGLTGVGGGSLMTPLLVLVFGIHPTTAVGTDLLFAATTKTVGTVIHSAGKTVDWRIVGRLALGSVPATLLTLLVTSFIGADSKLVTTAISLVLGVALLLTAVTLLFKDWIFAAAARFFPGMTAESPVWMTVSVGFVLGGLVSLSSVGAGALGTVALLYLYPKAPMVRIVGSDIAHAVPLTLLAGMGHWYMGTINFPLLGALLVGSIPGIIIGSYTARFAPERVLKLGLGVLLAVVGVKLLRGGS
ncbi:MAG: sulfite exporter TauE/SafE family protein [Acidocella sp.]|nr:sulfite exporter TauE/SafE family protein [Acidocella sp.]